MSLFTSFMKKKKKHPWELIALLFLQRRGVSAALPIVFSWNLLSCRMCFPPAALDNSPCVALPKQLTDASKTAASMQAYVGKRRLEVLLFSWETNKPHKEQSVSRAVVTLCTPDGFNHPPSTASSAADMRQTLQLWVKMPKGQNNSHRHLNIHSQRPCTHNASMHKQGLTRHSSHKKHQLHWTHDLEGWW